MTNPTNAQPTHGWDTYWQGARNAEELTAGGVCHPFFAAFWKQTLNDIVSLRDDIRVLDIATGSGAVVECLNDLPDFDLERITCVDISAAAIDGVRNRFPGISGIAADARSIPLPSGDFDIVTSQFGVEYAGLPAIEEAARLVAPGGNLALLMHIYSGAIYYECSTAVSAIQRTQDCRFVDLALRFFEAGFAAIRGADRVAYDEAGKQLNPAIQEVESVLADYGEHVAGDTVITLYSGVQKMHSRIQHYDPEDVLGWLRSLGAELPAYKERMASMCNSALDEGAFATQCDMLRGQGFTILQGEPLRVAEGELPFAWILRASKAE